MKTKDILIKQIRLGGGMPKICIPLMAADQIELPRKLAAVKEAGPDLVEWRADYYGKLKNPEAVAQTILFLKNSLGEIPLLFTVRTRAEGGEAELTTEEYCKINELAVRSGPDLMDVEVLGDYERKRRLIGFLQEAGTTVIASSHDFFKTDPPDKLLGRFEILDQSGADILKMAVMPHCFEDVLHLFEAAQKMREKTDKPLIFISMGRQGMISRLAQEATGSALTFGTAGGTSAPGQLPAKELRRLLQLLHGA